MISFVTFSKLSKGACNELTNCVSLVTILLKCSNMFYIARSIAEFAVSVMALSMLFNWIVIVFSMLTIEGVLSMLAVDMKGFVS